MSRRREALAQLHGCAYCKSVPVGPRPPIPPGFAKVVLSGTFFTHQFRNIFYLEVTGSGVTVNDLTAVALAIANAWNTNIAPAVTSEVTLTQVQVVFIPSVGSELVGSWSGTHVGSAAGAAIPDASACAVIDWAIPAYYRGGHPHTQSPGVPLGDVTNGSNIASTRRSALATGWNAFRNAINALTEPTITALTMGTLSFADNKLWRTTPIFRPYTSCTVRLVLGSVRRRLTS